VQRVTKYPLLLARLYKVTPHHHADRNAIKRAQDKIENALEQMNKDAKDVNSIKLWKRITMTSSNSNSPSKKSDSGSVGSGSGGGQDDQISSIKMRKMALEALGWPVDETRFPLEGRILFTQPNDGGNSLSNWHKKAWTVKLSPVQALLAVQCSEELPDITCKRELIFPPSDLIAPIRDASLIIVKKDNKSAAKFSLVRDPLSLERCIICCEQDWDDCFEIQEFVNKEQYVFKGEETGDTQLWFKTLQFYTQSLGGWRRRRKALGNIMIDPNVSPPAANSDSYYLECEARARRASNCPPSTSSAAAADEAGTPETEGASALPPTDG